MNIFDYFKPKNLEYLSCEWIESNIVFSYDGIYDCDIFGHTRLNRPILAELKHNNTFDYKKAFKEKRRHINQVRNGKIFDYCIGCPLLKKQVWNKKFKIKKLVIDANRTCNSDCIYCYTHNKKEYYNHLQDISVIEFLKQGLKKNIFDDGIILDIAGGEPTLNKEFDDILSLFYNVKNSRIEIYSNGINYNTWIEKYLREGRCEIIISPDSGDKVLYEKIKCVDKFDETWNNIKQYSNVQKNSDDVIVKYIILPTINDDKTSIKNFFNKIKETNVNIIRIELEFRYCRSIINDKDKIAEIFRLYLYMQSYEKEVNARIVDSINLTSLLKNNAELFKSIKQEMNK